MPRHRFYRTIVNLWNFGFSSREIVSHIAINHNYHLTEASIKSVVHKWRNKYPELNISVRPKGWNMKEKRLCDYCHFQAREKRATRSK